MIYENQNTVYLTYNIILAKSMISSIMDFLVVLIYFPVNWALFSCHILATFIYRTSMMKRRKASSDIYFYIFYPKSFASTLPVESNKTENFLAKCEKWKKVVTFMLLILLWFHFTRHTFLYQYSIPIDTIWYWNGLIS